MHPYRLPIPWGFKPAVVTETIAEGPTHDDLTTIKPTVFGLKIFNESIETTQEVGPNSGTVGAVQVTVGVGHGIPVKGSVVGPLNNGPIVVVLGVGGAQRGVVEVGRAGGGGGVEKECEKDWANNEQHHVGT